MLRLFPNHLHSLINMCFLDVCMCKGDKSSFDWQRCHLHGGGFYSQTSSVWTACAQQKTPGQLKKRSKDSVNADVHWCIIHPKQLEKYPRDRPCWELQFNKLPPTVRRTCAKHTTVQHRQPHNHNHWLPMVLLFQTTCCKTEAAEPRHSSQTNHINDRKENCIHMNE